jgi:hypothetical protein
MELITTESRRAQSNTEKKFFSVTSVVLRNSVLIFLFLLRISANLGLE